MKKTWENCPVGKKTGGKIRDGRDVLRSGGKNWGTSRLSPSFPSFPEREKDGAPAFLW
jgi:hypothetical protein